MSSMLPALCTDEDWASWIVWVMAEEVRSPWKVVDACLQLVLLCGTREDIELVLYMVCMKAKHEFNVKQCWNCSKLVSGLGKYQKCSRTTLGALWVNM